MKRNLYKHLIKLSLGTSLSFGLILHAHPTSSAPPPPKELNQTKLASQIITILLKHALTYDIDKRSVDSSVETSGSTALKGMDSVQSKIAKAIQANQPILLNCVGFPYKSQNTAKKVLTPQLDFAERHSLEYLSQMLAEISALYPPGAKLTIFTDGMVFCDMEGIDDQTVALYESQLKKISGDLPHIKIATLSDLLPNKTPEEMRAYIEEFAPSNGDFQSKLTSDPTLKEEVDLLSKRLVLELDHPEGRTFLSTNPAEDIAARLTQRSLQYSAFLKAHRRPEAIRLSVHFQPDIVTKMGIKLSETSYVTPWHGILIEKEDGTMQICHLEDVDTTTYTPATRTINGLPLTLLRWRQ